ncbi:hypothetical protein P4S72_13115 [Vibrio sp. PP-XX7]
MSWSREKRDPVRFAIHGSTNFEIHPEFQPLREGGLHPDAMRGSKTMRPAIFHPSKAREKSTGLRIKIPDGFLRIL